MGRHRLYLRQIEFDDDLPNTPRRRLRAVFGKSSSAASLRTEAFVFGVIDPRSLAHPYPPRPTPAATNEAMSENGMFSLSIILVMADHQQIRTYQPS